MTAAQRLALVSPGAGSVLFGDPGSPGVPVRATMAGVLRVRSARSSAPTVDPVVDPVVDALRRAGRGDEGAFAEFYDHVSAVVYGTVLRVLRDPAMSEEVTQEVFVELWRLAPRFDDGRGSPQSWAATVAHRRAVDRVRSEQSARNRDDAESRQVARPRDEVAEDVAERLERAQVAEALAGLSEAQREAVTLAYYGGHTYREVAELLGVPEGTVKTRIRDGLIKLRDLMGVAS